MLIPMRQRVEILSENLRRGIGDGYIIGRTREENPRYDIKTAEGLVYKNIQKAFIRIT